MSACWCFYHYRCHGGALSVTQPRLNQLLKGKIEIFSLDALVNMATSAVMRVGMSFASLLINSGRTLYEVQHILGHTQVKTTQRYAHLSHDTLMDTTNSVNTALGGMFMPMVSASPATLVHLVQ